MNLLFNFPGHGNAEFIPENLLSRLCGLRRGQQRAQQADDLRASLLTPVVQGQYECLQLVIVLHRLVHMPHGSLQHEAILSDGIHILSPGIWADPDRIDLSYLAIVRSFEHRSLLAGNQAAQVVDRTGDQRVSRIGPSLDLQVDDQTNAFPCAGHLDVKHQVVADQAL